MKKMTPKANTSEKTKRNPRFKQLLHKARGGDENAVGDLWREFNFNFKREGGRDAD